MSKNLKLKKVIKSFVPEPISCFRIPICLWTLWTFYELTYIPHISIVVTLHWSFRFSWDLISDISIVNSYSEANSRRVISWCLTFLMLLWCVPIFFRIKCHKSSGVHRWVIIAFHCSTRLMSLKTVLSSVRFMCLSSCTGYNQFASSSMDLPVSITTLVASELASTLMVMSCLFTHYWMGLFEMLLPAFDAGEGLILHRPIHPIVRAFALRFTNAVTIQSQPHTNKCQVNFPHMEKMLQQVNTLAQLYAAIAVFHAPPRR